MPASLKKILCVDDEEDILGIVAFSLEQVGHFTVQQCRGGKGALKAALDFEPDLILLDVMMPEQDGPATLAILQQTPKFSETPVVFMTAKVQASEVSKYLALGVCGVVPKPFDPMTISAEVEKLWNAHWAKRQAQA